MNEFTAILGAITAILSFLAAIISLLSNKSNDGNSSIQINGNRNSINQGDRNTTIIINHTTNTLDNKNRGPQNSAVTEESKTPFILFAIIVVLAIIAPILKSLICVAWILIIFSSLLNICICVCNRRNAMIDKLGFTRINQVVFLITPIVISTLFLIQHFSFLHDIDVEDILALTKAAISIVFAFAGSIFLISSQISVLLLTHNKFTSVKPFFEKVATLWPISLVFYCLPLLLFLI